MFFAYTSDYYNYVKEWDMKLTRFLMAAGSVYFGAVAGSYAGGIGSIHNLNLIRDGFKKK